MIQATRSWKGRRKRFRRKLARDLRVAMPGLLLLVSLVVTACVIAAAEAIPTRLAIARRVQHELAPVSAAAAEDSGEAVLDKAENDCARPPTSRSRVARPRN